MTATLPHHRPIRIHSLTDAEAACAAAADLGVPLLLVSAPGAAASAGAGWFAAVVRHAAARHPSVAIAAVLDGADRPGDALAALASGIEAVLFTGRADVAERLADIAGQRGARLLTALPVALDLRGVPDPRRACREWLGGQDDGQVAGHVTE
ncbi:class II fructose-bisphosphate aldolase [Azospirillum argentinense]